MANPDREATTVKPEAVIRVSVTAVVPAMRRAMLETIMIGIMFQIIVEPPVLSPSPREKVSTPVDEFPMNVAVRQFMVKPVVLGAPAIMAATRHRGTAGEKNQCAQSCQS